MSQEAGAEKPLKGLAWRLAATFLLGFTWLAFLIVWLFFFASAYSGYQNLAVILVSMVVSVGLLFAIWLLFGLRFAREVESVEIDWKGKKAYLGWRGAATIVIGSIWFVFFASWLFFFAGGYDFYQNLALIVVSLVFAGGITVILWSPFGWR